MSEYVCPVCGFDWMQAEALGLPRHACPCTVTTRIYGAIRQNQPRVDVGTAYADAQLLAYANPALYAPHTPAGA